MNAIKDKLKQSDNDWAENRKQYYLGDEKLFFANNIVKPDVVALESGVQYKIIKKGSGKLPKIKDTVTVNYRGILLDGTEFDSSYTRNSSDSFKLKDMITGFTQAMLQVPAGSQVIIYIPSKLGYGEQAAGNIPPNSTLIFEVDFIEIKN